VVVVAEAPSGVILFGSGLSAQGVGRSLSELAEHSEFGMLYADGRPYAAAEWQLARSIASGEIVVDEEFVHIMDGERRTYRCNSSPVYDGAGRMVAAVSITRDVTELKSVEERLAYHASLLDTAEDAIVGTDPEFRLTVWNRGAERLYGYAAHEVLGRDARDVARYAGDGSRLALERELLETDRTRTEITAYRQDGTPVEVELISVAVRDEDGSITAYLGIHRDITEQKRAMDQQALVADLGQRALRGDTVQSVMDQAVAIVARTLDLTPVGIAEILPGGEQLRLRAGTGWNEGAIGSATGGAGRASLVGYTVMAGEPVVSTDVAADPRFEISSVLRTHGTVSTATVVIAGRDQPFGVLGVFSKQRRSFSADDVNFLQAAANVISMAVERAESENRIIQVRDAERRRIARDLHDDALQDLTDALAQATGLESAGDPVVADRLAQLVPALKRAGQHVRGAIYDLRLGADEERPFPELLREVVDVHHAMAPDRRIELDVRFPAIPLGRRGTEVLRVTSEALVNARRHSGAGSIRVQAWGSDERLCVAVSDDGHGFEPSIETPAGAGIRGMRERAGLLAGDLEIRSEPGAGTTVQLGIALRPDGGRPDQTVRLLLVEDHTSVREAIARMFEREPGLHVVGQAATLAQAREMLQDIDVAVVDLRLPDGTAGDLIRDLRKVNPRAQALVLSASLDRRELAATIESGASGVLSKTAGFDEVVDAVRRLRAGETLMPLDEVVELLRFAGRERDREREDRHSIASLTPREREVLQALAEGLDSATIASRLHITVRTERNHVANILAKLGVHSQLQAVLFAARYGVVELGAVGA
jgi:PAS domain S-box-containing protein